MYVYSAKSHLEISKIHSGLVGGEEFLFKNREHKVNLDVAKYHLELAEEIDPQYCDVHFQVAQLLVLQNKALLKTSQKCHDCLQIIEPTPQQFINI